MTPPPPATATARSLPSPRRRAETPRPAARPPLTVVDRSARRRRVRRRPLPEYLAVTLVVGSLLAVVVGHTVLASDQVRLTVAQSQLAAAQVEEHVLETDVATREAPPRIAQTAQHTYHYSQALPVQLPYVPLSKPLPAPSVTPAPATTGQ